MAKIAKMIYADSERCADLLYRTGLFIPDPILWFSIDNSSFILVNSMEYNRARREAQKETEVISFENAKKKYALRNYRVESQILGISKFYGINKWLVPKYFPYSIVENLSRHKIKFKTEKSAFFPSRECKTKMEISKILEGVQLAEAGLARALNLLHEAKIKGKHVLLTGTPLTCEILQGEINAEISRNGGVASHTIVACGPQGADPHNSGSGPILSNQPIIIDIFPRVTTTGYFGDLTRTVVKGEAPLVVKNAFQAVHKSCQVAIREIKANVDGKSIHKKVMDTLKNMGFKSDLEAEIPFGFIHGTGHGLGLDIHESPRISSVKSILKEGNVVTIEPGLYYPEWGGVRIEDVVVVQKGGCRNLTSAPIELEIP